MLCLDHTITKKMREPAFAAEWDSLEPEEQIVRAMERGDVPLEESLKLFEEGTSLVRRCGSLLDGAELQIKQVMKGPDGAPVEMEFGSHE